MEALEIGFRKLPMKKNNHKSVLLVIAHPDDEVIFFSPLILKTKKLMNNLGLKEFKLHIICLTCGSNKVRSKEFSNSIKFTNKIANFQIFDEPIIRGIKLDKLSHYYSLIERNLPKNCEAIFTHSIFGDNHFHPQHVLLSLASIKVARNKNTKLFTCGDAGSSIKSIKEYLFNKKFLVNGLSGAGKTLIKIFLIFLFILFFKRVGSFSIERKKLECFREIYSSQSLEYPSFIDNSFPFSILR